jgi:hypothetical protein
LRARCGAQSQFVAYPPDLCDGDDPMDLLQGYAQAAERTADGKAVRRTVSSVMV